MSIYRASKQLLPAHGTWEGLGGNSKKGTPVAGARAGKTEPRPLGAPESKAAILETASASLAPGPHLAFTLPGARSNFTGGHRELRL